MAGAPSAARLVARGLGVSVKGRTLWRDLQLTVMPGERWAVAGPSGSGKTLLLRTLAALTPCASGEISVDGKPLRTWWMPAYRAQVIYLPQRPALPEGTVEAALAAPFKLRVHRAKRFPAQTLRRFMNMLDVGESFLQQQTDVLSGGEGQLVAVLRAILLEPTFLLLDEPTASLDAAHVERVEALVREWLGRERGHAYIWTSHDSAQLGRVSDRVLTLQSPA